MRESIENAESSPLDNYTGAYKLAYTYSIAHQMCQLFKVVAKILIGPECSLALSISLIQPFWQSLAFQTAMLKNGGHVYRHHAGAI